MIIIISNINIIRPLSISSMDVTIIFYIFSIYFLRKHDVVRNRIGERIMTSMSVGDPGTVFKNEHITRDGSEATCVFWKIFFSVVVLIFLVLLFVCSYRFLYAKLRCICRRRVLRSVYIYIYFFFITKQFYSSQFRETNSII